MRSIMKGLVVASAGFAMFVTPAAAADNQDEMREMKEMVLKLQDQLDAQQGQIDEQEGVIREAGLEDERGSASALSSFLESTDFNGWVAASYFYNFNNPHSGNTGGGTENGPFDNPFHPAHNSFQFDEAWFVIDRTATEESPAGFHFEIVYGETATAIQSSQGDSNGQGNDFWIPTANVSYMTPWGQTVTAGKFGTTIGYEVAGAPSNVNITRGITYNLLQPISHLGATVSQDFDSGLTYTFGVVNGFGTNQPDINNSKGFLWQVGWGNDTMTFLFNGIYEDNPGGGTDEGYTLDFVAEMTPTDNVLFWANVDYTQSEAAGTNVDATGYGLALGGRVGITDDFGLGGRGEFVRFEDDANGAGDGEVWAFTATTDYALTDNLTWKVEAKYEWGTDIVARDSFPNGSTGTEDDAFFLGTQLYYEF